MKYLSVVNRSRLIVVAMLAFAVASLAVGIGAVRGEANRGQSPGVAAGVSAFAELPPQVGLSSEVTRFVQSAASATGTDVAVAAESVRLLRADLGSAKRKVYGFLSASGSPCFLLTSTSATCARKPEDGTPGLHWMIGGGSEDALSALVGIAADDVAAVRLTVDGGNVPVTLANNVVFAEYAEPARKAEIVVERADGATHTETLNLAG